MAYFPKNDYNLTLLNYYSNEKVPVTKIRLQLHCQTSYTCVNNVYITLVT
jgi:hypothetical protein